MFSSMFRSDQRTVDSKPPNNANKIEAQPFYKRTSETGLNLNIALNGSRRFQFINFF